MRRLLLLQVLLLILAIFSFSEAKKNVFASLEKGKKNPFEKSKQGNANANANNNGNSNGNANGNGNGNSNNNGNNNGNGNGKGNKVTLTTAVPTVTTSAAVVMQFLLQESLHQPRLALRLWLMTMHSQLSLLLLQFQLSLKKSFFQLRLVTGLLIM